MPLTEFAIGSTMRRRVTLAMALLSAALLLGIYFTTVRTITESNEQHALDGIVNVSRDYARELRTRLLAAESIAHVAVGGDAGVSGFVLRQRLAHSAAIAGVMLADVTFEHLPVDLSASDRLALRGGQTLLRNGSRDDLHSNLYMVRAVIANGSQLAIMELNRDWLWQGMDEFPRSHRLLAVLDGNGALLMASGEVPHDLLAMFSRERLSVLSTQQDSALRSWSLNGMEWRGAVLPVLPDEVHLTAGRWTIVVGMPATALSSVWQPVGRAMWPLVLGALLLIAVLGWYLQRLWQPTLDALRASLHELANGRYQRVACAHAADEPQRLAQDFNATITALEARMRGLASLNEIDRMLLETAELESCLDRLLDRVGHITGCDGAMLVLFDRDAIEYGRAYVSNRGTPALISRISLDPALLSQLFQERTGLTIARFESGRHSLIEPLREGGSEFFWVWPVISQDSLVAALAVGYRGAPAVGAEVAGYGTECAARIGVALSNSARGEQLYRQAHFDPLTSLPNRLLFRDRLSQELVSASEGVHRGALLYVDLDHFKKVNDTVGHGAGDQMLQIVAQRLRSCVKDGDTVARLGGDEFTVILRSVGNAEGARRVADRIIDVLQQPVNIGGRDYFVRASIGVTLFPDDGIELDELMRNADLAMYRAKETGRSRAVFYDRAMQKMPALAAESGLYRALQRREFSLYYQPQYALGDGSLSGLEALLRWQPPRENMRFPAEFVPAAEQSGLIVDIGAWVLEAACEQLAQWCAEGIAPPRLALNVSVQQLRQPDFPKLVRNALERARIPPERLEIELTESVFADDEALVTLRRLAALGVRLSLDDFGTGYSSLGYLRAHPVHAIKIDRSFIEGVASNITAATLAETMITMAHALGKQVVAEGVETMEQLEFLRERRCDFAQGFYFARPAAAAEITNLLRGRRATELPQLLHTA
jgi:diguanylate cyclase (GGDEF)-like protein